jgi:uncharacterized coiled-coil DUF342 family protein
MADTDCNKVQNINQLEKRLQCLQKQNSALEKELATLKKEVDGLKNRAQIAPPKEDQKPKSNR